MRGLTTLTLGLGLLLLPAVGGAQITRIIDATGDGTNALATAIGIAADTTGNVYVTGNVSRNAFRIAPGGGITQIIDTTGDGTNPLLSPQGVAVDATGSVYVTGRFGSDNAFRITPGGGITQIIDATGDGTNPLTGAFGVAVDATGNVYVAGNASNNAFQITPGGAITQIIDATGDGTNTLSGPSGVAVDASANVYVVGRSSNNAFQIAPGGGITEIIDATGDGTNALSSPSLSSGGVAVDATGNVYVAGNGSNNAFQITPGGTITQIIDATGDGTNALTSASSVAVDASGNVYVPGFISRNVFQIAPGGGITQIIDATGDGTNPFGSPFNVAVDATGNVYVTSLNDVFKITLVTPTTSTTSTSSTSTSTTSTSTTTSTTLPPGACPATPDGGCVDLTGPGTRLVLRENSPGRERLIFRSGKGTAQTATDFGDPTTGGGTDYALCVYDHTGTLVQDYIVDRAGDTCGSLPCWGLIGHNPVGGPRHKGYLYRDNARTADGIKVLRLRATSTARVSARGGNGAGGATLPTGVTAALEDATSATVQVHGSDAAVCLSATLAHVRRATSTAFVATD